MRDVFDHRRRTIHKMLNECNGVTCAEPEGAFYAFPSVERADRQARSPGGRSTHRWTWRRWRSTRPRSPSCPGEAFGTPGYFRLSYALSDDDLVEGVRRLGELFATAS